jgi:hypothetical protein
MAAPQGRAPRRRQGQPGRRGRPGWASAVPARESAATDQPAASATTPWPRLCRARPGLAPRLSGTFIITGGPLAGAEPAKWHPGRSGNGICALSGCGHRRPETHPVLHDMRVIFIRDLDRLTACPCGDGGLPAGGCCSPDPVAERRWWPCGAAWMPGVRYPVQPSSRMAQPAFQILVMWLILPPSNSIT